MLKLKNENTKFREAIRILQKELKKLSSAQIMTKTPNSPSKVLFDAISPNSKKRAILRLKDKTESLPRGTTNQIRNKFGINLSKQTLPKPTPQSSIRAAVEAFLCRDDITKICPDKHKQVDGKQIRFLLNHLNVLHQQFEFESNIDIDYVTFTRYVPSYIQKPKTDSWEHVYA